MRKKELLKHIPEDLPGAVTAEIIRDGKEKVLMLILPERIRLNVYGHPSDCNKGTVVHFTGKKRYLTYYVKNGTWTGESLMWLEYHTNSHPNTPDQDAMLQIRAFTGRLGTLSDVEYHEEEMSAEKRYRSAERKQRKINKLMEDTPKLPRNFRRWCERKLKASRKKKINIKLFQPLPCGEKIERIFQAESNRITELCRAYTDEYGDAWKVWYYGEYDGKSGANQRFWDRKRGTAVNALPKYHYIYDNLDTLEMTPAQRSVLRIMDGRDDPSHVLNALHFHPEYERVIKAGLIRFATEIRWYWEIDTWLERIRCLPKDRLKRLVKQDGGIKAWEMLKLAKQITDENLKLFCEIKSEYKANMILSFVRDEGLNINHLYTLWKKTGGVTMETLNKYSDYLGMAAQQGKDIHDEIIYRDKKWRQRHDECVEQLNREKEEKRRKEEEAKLTKYKAIKKDYRRNCALFAWKDENYVILIPKSAAEINEEGRRQHHCVGSREEYKMRMATRESFIVFLRKKENPTEPYYTVEVDSTKIRQYYAAYDRQPDKKQVSAVLAKWMKQVRKNFRNEKSLKEKKPKAVAAG